MSISIGTKHFGSRFAAVNYYKQYGLDEDDVDFKIRQKEIKIGMPSLVDGDKAYLDLDDRWVIVSKLY